MANRWRRAGRVIGVVALAALLAACGPADYLPAPDLPSPPTGTVTPWRPVVGRPAPLLRVLDNSLLTGQPCAPPCWQGLEAGVTSGGEVALLLDNSPLVGSWEVERLPDGDEVYRWWWARPTVTVDANTFRVSGDVLRTMTLYPETPVTLGEVMAVYGAPAWVDVDGASPGPAGWTVDIYYPERGLVLVLHIGSGPEEIEICLEATTPVAAAIYLAAGTAESLLAARHDGAPVRPSADRLRTWDGRSCLPLGE